MSLLLTGLLVVSGVMAGRWLSKRTRHRIELPVGRDDENAMKNEEALDPFEQFPCRLGDAVMVFGGEEAWLAGALVFSEDSPSLVLFIAPDAGADRALLVRPRPTGEIVWLLPVDASDLVGMSGNAEPPSSLEHEGERYERLRRLPLRVERHGTGVPDLGKEVILVEYKTLSGGRFLVIAGSAGVHAWQGTALAPGMYDVLASEK